MIRMCFPPISTRQSFIDDVEIYSDDDGTPFDLTGATIQVAIALSGQPQSRSGYYPFYDGSAWPAPRLLASTADGSVVIPDLGVFTFNFTPSQIASLCPGQYVVGMTFTRDGETEQLILGDLPVLDGVVLQ